MKRKNKNRKQKRKTQKVLKLSSAEIRNLNKENVGGTSTYIQGMQEQVSKCDKCINIFNSNKRINKWMLKCFKVYITARTLDELLEIKELLKNPKYPHAKIGYLYNRDDKMPLTGVIYTETHEEAAGYLEDFKPRYIAKVKQGCKNMRVLYPYLHEWGRIKEVYEW